MKEIENLGFDPALMLESMTESVLITTTDLASPGPFVIYVNAAFEEMTGWKRQEIIGKSPRVLQGPKTEFSIFEDLEKKLEAGLVWSGRTINYRKDGSEFHMDWSITPIRTKDGVIDQYLAVQKEVTKIVLTEQKLQKAMDLEKKRLIEIQKTNQKLNRLISKQNKTLTLFRKYVPAPIIKKALAHRQEDVRQGEMLEVTLMFCDIRGFTGIAERLKPNEVVSLLNTYYSVMSDIIKTHGGVINEFVGDEIFVSFGAPLPIEEPQFSAVRCALAMIEGVKEVNARLKDSVEVVLEVGIGINHGRVIVGNLGSEDRLTYSITGSPVITAKRIESLTRDKRNAILISQNVYDVTRHLLKTKTWGKVDIKGKDDKIDVYEVLAMVDEG